MNKAIITFLLLSSMSSPLYADGKATAPITQANYTPFASAEGSYTWSSFNNASDSTSGLVTTPERWGGRLAVGVNHPWKENLGLSFEAGYGYYGSMEGAFTASVRDLLLNADVNLSTNTDILGADFLAGIFYTHNKFDVFAKAGMMVETFWAKGSLDAGAHGFLDLLDLDANIKARIPQTAVLPEIKVGGDYNINESIGLSLAYLHVFGSNNNGAVVNLPSDKKISPITVDVDMHPVTLNAIMFGIHYNFV